MNGGNKASIERSDLDGSNRTIIIRNGLKKPMDIAIDYRESLLYWVDGEKKIIESSDLHGQNRRVVVRSLPSPYALTQYDGYIYWSDWETNAIERANKSTGMNRTRISGNVDFVMDIVVFHASKQEGNNS